MQVLSLCNEETLWNICKCNGLYGDAWRYDSSDIAEKIKQPANALTIFKPKFGNIERRFQQEHKIVTY